MTVILSATAETNPDSTYNARIPTAMMFKHICLVNAARTVGAAWESFSSEYGNGPVIEVRVLHSVGELQALSYTGES
jgi:PHP family Zn ribbon phosphoesterase